MKPIKETRTLPGRGGLNDLVKSGQSILDYSKATPETEISPATVLNLANKPSAGNA